MNILITGAGGLIGSEAVEYFSTKGHQIYGIENNQRQVFFGEMGSTVNRLNELKCKHKNFVNHSIDIRNRTHLSQLFNS